MQANGVEKMRLVSGGGVNISSGSSLTIVPFVAAGVVHNAAGGLLLSSLIVGSDVTSNTLTYNKISQASASTLLGNPNVGTANIQEIQLDPTLKFSGSALAINLANANNWTGAQTITGANKFAYVDGNQTAGFILSENGAGIASWVSPSTLTIVTTATGTAPITVNGDNAAHSGAITIALNQGNLTSTGSITVGGTGKTVGANITADLNLANANTWTGAQTLAAEAHTPMNSALGAGPMVNDFPLGAANSYYRISSAANINLTGLTNGFAGRTVVLQNVGANTITLKSQTGSAPANRFDLPGGADIILGAKAAITLIYDGTLNLWEVVSSN
jgi:hypothetical protein